MDVGQGGQVRLLDGGDAALARVQRSVLVQLRDAGGHEVVDGRSGEEDEGAALGQREGGRAAHAHPAHAVRRAAPADQHDQVHRERREDPLQRQPAARFEGRERRGSGTDGRDAAAGKPGAGRRRTRRPRRRRGAAAAKRRAPGAEAARTTRSSGGWSTTSRPGRSRSTRSTNPRRRRRPGRASHPTSSSSSSRAATTCS